VAFLVSYKREIISNCRNSVYRCEQLIIRIHNVNRNVPSKYCSLYRENSSGVKLVMFINCVLKSNEKNNGNVNVINSILYH